MLEEGEDLIYYLTIYNENLPQPALPDDVEEGILAGMYRFRPAPEPRRHAVQLLGSGTILYAVLRAQEILAERYDVAADVWSAPSFTCLRREALECERHNREHPESPLRVPLVTRLLEPTSGPVIAASDWIKAVPDQIARWVPRRWHSLGTDGWGRSDTREALRRFFRIDAENVVLAALAQLAAEGRIEAAVVAQARRDLGLEDDPSLLVPDEPPLPIESD
jgi:pyruvate dehydrogenase E1 component